MPLAVAQAGTRVANRVLPAQLVGDARRRAIEILQIVDDLRPAAGVVGDPSQRVGVDTLVSARAPSPGDLREDRRKSPSTPAPAPWRGAGPLTSLRWLRRA